MSDSSKYWIPIIAAAEGDFVTGEIQSNYKPSPLSPSSSISLTRYANSFLVRSYRREWNAIDQVADRPELHEVDKAVRLPVNQHPLAPLPNPPKKCHMPSESARLKGWELRIWGRYEGIAGPHIGKHQPPQPS